MCFFHTFYEQVSRFLLFGIFFNSVQRIFWWKPSKDLQGSCNSKPYLIQHWQLYEVIYTLLQTYKNRNMKFAYNILPSPFKKTGIQRLGPKKGGVCFNVKCTSKNSEAR